jgi:hypothetical protein
MKAFGWIAIAGGAYLLYEYMQGNNILGNLVSGASAGQPVTPTTGTSTAAGQTPASATQTNTLQLVINAYVKASGGFATDLLTFDDWNFYYSQVRGITGPDPNMNLTSTTRNMKMSAQQWWGYMTQDGFSGLGMIAHYVNPYTMPKPYHSQFGANLQANGFEKYLIVKGG